MKNPMPELAPMLKRLHLSGILDSLEARNRQAIESKLAYTDFIALLIQDEIARREQRYFESRLRTSQVLSDKTLERFDFDHSVTLDRAQLADLATGRFIRENAPVLIVGPTGTGKSHLAQALGHCALRLGFTVLFTTPTKVLNQLHAARATDTFARKLQALTKIDLICIDDFGLKPCTHPKTKISTSSSPSAMSGRAPSLRATLTSANGRPPSLISSSAPPPSTASATERIASCSTARATANHDLSNRLSNRHLPRGQKLGKKHRFEIRKTALYRGSITPRITGSISPRNDKLDC